MKMNKIIKGLGALLLVGTVASCSSDYLDLEPISQVDRDEVTSSATGLRMAVYGICRNMYSQWSTFGDPPISFNGEPALGRIWGEIPGQDLQSGLWYRAGVQVIMWQLMTESNYITSQVPWSYCYSMINQANVVLDGMEGKELSGESAFRVAQAYAFRAHAYTRLLQIFGPRWSDSENGEVEAVVLRTKVADPSGDTGAPMASTGTILKLIYDDLDESIRLFKLSEFSRTYNWEPDLSIAYGLYARAALLKDDWAKAKEMAHNAREGYKIMSGEDYTAGFAEPTSEWMWNSAGNATGMYFMSFGSWYACNGYYPCMWAVDGAGSIDFELYSNVNNPRDARCSLYFTPDKVKRAQRSLFWNAANVDQTNMNINYGPDLSPLIAEFCQEKYNAIGAPKGWEFPYNSTYGDESKTPSIGNVMIPFGAQFKFWGTDSYASSCYPFMRASEMALIEAEAACNQEDYATAQDCLFDVNSNRIEGYSKSTNTGEALLTEIQIYRRFELWGEGFSWFDFKRWSKTITRIPWIEGNTQSGNWPLNYSAAARECTPEMNNGWRWAIPRSETLYNTDLTGGNKE